MTTSSFVRASLFLAAPVLAFVACSSTPSVEDFCGKLKARYDACPSDGTIVSTSTPDGGTTTPTRDPFNQARCTNDHACLTAVFENAVTNSYLDCASNTDCSVRTSKCDEQAFAAGTHATEADTCAKKYADCKASKSSFSDDYCVNVRGLNTDSLSKVMTCFDKPCEQVKDCFKATLKAVSPACDF